MFCLFDLKSCFCCVFSTSRRFCGDGSRDGVSCDAGDLFCFYGMYGVCVCCMCVCWWCVVGVHACVDALFLEFSRVEFSF